MAPIVTSFETTARFGLAREFRAGFAAFSTLGVFSALGVLAFAATRFFDVPSRSARRDVATGACSRGS
jgi:hypothetical protein